MSNTNLHTSSNSPANKITTFEATSSREKKRSANRVRHRLLSIRYDVGQYLRSLLNGKHLEGLPLVANERCGTWYALPFQPHSFCHFKSTDGHVHLFSLKRLNLPFLKTVAKHQSVVLVDASNKKEMPDSFSRTLPIWSCVLNRIAERYRRDMDMESLFDEDEDMRLYLPDWIIPNEEQNEMNHVIETRVDELYQSEAIVDIPGFLALLQKPIRPFWITPLHSELPDDSAKSRFHCIICCNASNVCLDSNNGEYNRNKSRIVWRDDDQFWYTPGAADDEESWARHLTPTVFWEVSDKFSPQLSDQQTEDLIDDVVQTVYGNECMTANVIDSESYDWIGNLNIAIGTRRAGRPAECWNHFDCILNVTNTQYESMIPSLDNQTKRFYLQLPVQEGKRDKQELERWMAIGILFCAHHAKHNRRILVHCAQGKDRSVAIVMATVHIFCKLRYPLQWNQDILRMILHNVIISSNANTGVDGASDPNELETQHRQAFAGLPISIFKDFAGQHGRDLLVSMAHQAQGLSHNDPLATKDTMRVVLHLIRQDREKAEPTRSTMQKLNRFFMSKEFEPDAARRD